MEGAGAAPKPPKADGAEAPPNKDVGVDDDDDGAPKKPPPPAVEVPNAGAAPKAGAGAPPPPNRLLPPDAGGVVVFPKKLLLVPPAVGVAAAGVVVPKAGAGAVPNGPGVAGCGVANPPPGVGAGVLKLWTVVAPHVTMMVAWLAGWLLLESGTILYERKGREESGDDLLFLAKRMATTNRWDESYNGKKVGSGCCRLSPLPLAAGENF